MAKRADDLKVFDLVIDEDSDDFADRIRRRSGFRKIGSGMHGRAYANDHLIWKIESGYHETPKNFNLSNASGWSQFIIDVRRGVYGKSPNVPSVKMLVLLSNGIAALTNRVNVVGQTNQQTFPRAVSNAVKHFCDIVDTVSYYSPYMNKENENTPVPWWFSGGASAIDKFKKAKNEREFVDAVISVENSRRKTVDILESNNIHARQALRWFAKNNKQLQKNSCLDIHSGNLGVDNRGNIVFFDPVT